MPSGMRDIGIFANEIFGFHAQQAIEKSLKAWIMRTQDDYPLTHNVIILLSVLEENGENVERFWSLVKYNAFAVQFRYEQMNVADEYLDRAQTIDEVSAVVCHVHSLIR